jgi:enediyne biosynthesis protein E5
MLEPMKVSIAGEAIAVPATGRSGAERRSSRAGQFAASLNGALRRLDARFFQIVFLGTLLLFGALVRDFALQWEQVALTFAAGLGAQAFWIKALGLKNVGYLSALVTCLGTSILVRADSYWVHPLLAAVAMSSKFTIRIRGKHLYNPANLAVILAIAVVPGAWASPGQWGSDVLIGLWFVCLGVTVTTSAKRLDIAWAFLGFYTALLALRMFVLGQPHAVPIHQLSSGAILLFTFFMISDPMTTPNRRALRFAYAFLVAMFAFVWQFHFFQTNGPVWALFFLTPLVPLIDWLWPGKKHVWQTQARAVVQAPISNA